MKALLCVLALFSMRLASAQDYAYIEQDSTAVPFYKLSDYPALYDVNIYFPYDGGKRGVDMVTLMSKKSQSLRPVRPVNVSALTRVHIPVFYASNVKKFTLHVSDTRGNHYQISRVLQADGYQASVFSSLEKIDQSKFATQDAPVLCTVETVDQQKPAQLIMSDLVIADYGKKRIISPLPFFKTVYAYNDKQAITTLNPIFKSAKSAFNWLSVEYCQSPVYINSTDKSIPAGHRLYKIVGACLAAYPFYSEKHIDPKKVQAEFETIWNMNQTKPDTELARIVQNFLRRTFHDGHFKVEFKHAADKTNQVAGPVRLSKIKGSYVVSAVLDTLLEQAIPIGSVITRINGQRVEDIADSLININYSKEYALKRHQLVNQDVCRELTTFGEGTNVAFDYVSPSGMAGHISTVYRKRYPIKPNFANAHCEFKHISPSVTYFKFNAFDELPALRLQTRIESIKHNDLVLDIRGNGGGDVAYLDDFLSLLIQPKNFQIFKGTNRSGLVRDSVYISVDNPSKLDSTSRIVVLIDSRTSCTSELFIYLLKKYNKNVTVVGSDNTSGTLANAFAIIFPDKDYFLTVNAPEIFKHDLGFPLEDIGIQPDIKVSIDSVYDLKPYNDKVLKAGLEYLQKSDRQKSPVLNRASLK